MKNNQRGFGVVEILVTVLVLGLIVAIAWLVLHPKSSNTTSSSPEKLQPTSTKNAQDKKITALTPYMGAEIKIEGESSFNSTDKQEIVSRYVEPMVFYYQQILKIDITEVKITKNTSMTNASDARYAIGYTTKDDPSHQSSYIVGYNNTLGYWQPQLCDDGGCMDYPAAFKEKFPKNYDFYLACKDSGKNGSSPSECMVF